MLRVQRLGLPLAAILLLLSGGVARAKDPSGDGQNAVSPRLLGDPGTFCTCKVDGVPTECPIINTTGFPQSDCGTIEIGGGGGGFDPDGLPPDLTPLGKFFVFGRPGGAGSCVPQLEGFEPGDPVCGQVIFINEGGLDTTDPLVATVVEDVGRARSLRTSRPEPSCTASGRAAPTSHSSRQPTTTSFCRASARRTRPHPRPSPSLVLNCISNRYLIMSWTKGGSFAQDSSDSAVFQ